MSYVFIGCLRRDAEKRVSIDEILEDLQKYEQAELVKKKQIEEEKINHENKAMQIRKEIVESGKNIEDYMAKFSSAKARYLEDSEIEKIQALLGNEFSKENLEEIKKIIGHDQDIFITKPIILIESEEWLNFKELLKERPNIKAIKLQTSLLGHRKMGNINEFLKLIEYTGLISIDFDGFFESQGILAEFIKNSKLIHLGLTNNDFSRFDKFPALCNSLRDNNFLLSLDFSKNRLEGGNLYKFLSTVISNSKSIARVNLKRNKLEKISYPLQRIWEAMCEKKSIVEEIILDHRVIRKEDTKKFKNFDEFYQQFPLYSAPDEKRFSPEEINQLLHNDNKEISEIKPKEIIENNPKDVNSKKDFYFSLYLNEFARNENNKLNFFNLDRKSREKVFKQFIEIFLKEEESNKLDLDRLFYELTENEFVLLCSAIKKKECLKILRLSNNTLCTEKRFHLLCDAIQDCKSLIELDLSDNGFGKKKAKENFNLLCKTLIRNQTIKIVSLRGRDWNRHIVESRSELIWNLLIKSTCLEEIQTPQRIFVKKEIMENPNYDEFLKTHSLK